MKSIAFYLGLGLMFTHELDAVANHEWRVLPGLASLSDSAGETTFLIAHIPLFAVLIALVASLNLQVRNQARAIVAGFLVVHAVLHLLFSRVGAYEFTSTLSSVLIYGGAVCGVAYFLTGAPTDSTDAA